jgi:hypothetical protein
MHAEFNENFPKNGMVTTMENCSTKQIFVENIILCGNNVRDNLLQGNFNRKTTDCCVI